MMASSIGGIGLSPNAWCTRRRSRRSSRQPQADRLNVPLVIAIRSCVADLVKTDIGRAIDVGRARISGEPPADMPITGSAWEGIGQLFLAAIAGLGSVVVGSVWRVLLRVSAVM